MNHQPPDWPNFVDLPSGQPEMNHADWIAYIDPIIEAYKDVTPYDDFVADDLRAIRDWHRRQLELLR
jgi:hypothetical protein